MSPRFRRCQYNGIEINRFVRYCHLLFEPGSDYRPSSSQDIEDYESTLCGCLTEAVETGDDVVIVGGGFGVTTIHAARAAGPEGHVTVYEASDDRFADLKQALALDASERAAVTPIHAMVGENIKVYGQSVDCDTVSPAAIPACDVLELDCEGAERQILDELTIRPRTILVETHGFRGAPTEEIKRKLEEMGYDVIEKGVAEPRLRSECEERDIYVLSATLSSSRNA